MARSPFSAASSVAVTTTARPAIWSAGKAAMRLQTRVAPPHTRPTPCKRQHAARRQARSVAIVHSVCSLVYRLCKGGGFAASWVAKHYPLLRKLVLAHLAGVVRLWEYAERLVQCGQCYFAYERMGERYCRGDNHGKGCGCGHWKGSRLSYKLKLAAFRCPQARFGYGGNARLVQLRGKQYG